MTRSSSSTDTGIAALLVILGIAPLIFLSTIYSAFFTGLMGWQLWQWFLIPLNLPDVSGWHIAGLCLVARAAMPMQPKSTSSDETAAALSRGFVYPPLTAVAFLLSGWIIAKLAGLI